jgi:AraC-like DNA-binding protein
MTLDDLCQTVESRLAATCIETPRTSAIDAWANHFKMPSTEFWFCSYGEPVKLAFAESDYFRIQFPHAGSGMTRCGRLETTVAPGRGCISSAAATIAFGPGFQQLVWRVNRDALGRKLSALTGQPLRRALEFNPVLTPSSGGLMSVLVCTLLTIANRADGSNAFLLAELEQAMMVALLTGSEHNYRALLDAPAPRGTPWLVRRVEEHIEAHWDKPFDIEQAVSITGRSARTLYRAFQRVRGYSPLEFSKQRRLLKAQEMLRDGSVARTVIEAAMACGFSDMSHFSRDFVKAFGMTPSSVLKSRT